MSRQPFFLALFFLALFLSVDRPALSMVEVATAQGVLAPLGAGFTYQGQLKQNGSAVNATCDFQFGLFDAASAGAQIGSTQTVSSVSVSNGLFSVALNAADEFGSGAFAGDARWLEIAVRCPAGSGNFTTLSPRQALTAAPYALFAQNTSGTPYQNVVVVAKSGGDFTSIQAALNSITNASATNPYLVWIAPGVYAETVTMKPFVDIEGAGELLTKITAAGSASVNTGTVMGASNAELRFLTVENTGGNTYATAIYNNAASPRISHVAASASGGNQETTGVYSTAVSKPTMTDVTISLSGGARNHGITSVNSQPTLVNVTVSVSGATILNRALDSAGVSLVTVRNSTISASGIAALAIANDALSIVRVATSMLDGSSSGGTTTCAGVYNGSFTFFASTCP